MRACVPVCGYRAGASGPGQDTLEAVTEHGAQKGKKDTSWNRGVQAGQAARLRMVHPQTGSRKELRGQLEPEEEARETEAAMYAPGLFRCLAPRVTLRPVSATTVVTLNSRDQRINPKWGSLLGDNGSRGGAAFMGLVH